MGDFFIIKLIFIDYKNFLTDFIPNNELFFKNIHFNQFKFCSFFTNVYISITKYIKSVIFLF